MLVSAPEPEPSPSTEAEALSLRMVPPHCPCCRGPGDKHISPAQFPLSVNLCSQRRHDHNFGDLLLVLLVLLVLVGVLVDVILVLLL